MNQRLTLHADADEKWITINGARVKIEEGIITGGAGGKFNGQKPKDVGKSAFGPIFAEYKDNPAGAIKRLIREQTGDAHAVWTRPDLGSIDLIWGDKKGGLCHIVDKHPDILAKLPHILKNGKLYRKPGAQKAFLVVDGNPPDVAVIALDWKGKEKTWVVTGYKDERGEFTGSLKTIDTETLGSAPVEVLGTGQRTPHSTPKADSAVNAGLYATARRTWGGHIAIEWHGDPAAYLAGFRLPPVRLTGFNLQA
jgi:hypothetical protein